MAAAELLHLAELAWRSADEARQTLPDDRFTRAVVAFHERNACEYAERAVAQLGDE